MQVLFSRFFVFFPFQRNDRPLAVVVGTPVETGTMKSRTTSKMGKNRKIVFLYRKIKISSHEPLEVPSLLEREPPRNARRDSSAADSHRCPALPRTDPRRPTRGT